jgi:hypothetical protein
MALVVQEQKRWWGGYISLPSFLMGVAGGVVVSYFVFGSSRTYDKQGWGKPRFHQGHPILSKEEILQKFRADFSSESYQTIKDAWKDLCMHFFLSLWSLLH